MICGYGSAIWTFIRFCQPVTILLLEQLAFSPEVSVLAGAGGPQFVLQF
jgi:hypothetical protein